jgi:hypothetical protein
VPENLSPNLFGVRITLLDYQPEIWRRVLVPGSVRLDKLHMIFQEAMGWTNSHLHQFRIGDALYGMHFEDWPEEELHEAEFKLADVTHGGERFRYDYDFGDSWEHEVLVERADTIRPALKFAVCLDGANACPPEDCGGTGGYADLLEALANPGPQGARALPAVGGRRLQPRGLRSRRHERRAPAPPLINPLGAVKDANPHCQLRD